VGSCRFERVPPIEGSNKNIIEFDSSADRAIARQYGYDIPSVELRETSRDEQYISYDVYSRQFSGEGQPEKPLQFRLTQLTRAEIRERNSGALSFANPWG
jgi:hypothetical protein